MRRLAQLHLGRVEHRVLLVRLAGCPPDGTSSRMSMPSSDQPCDVATARSSSSVSDSVTYSTRFAAPHALEQELQRERRLARAGHAFDQVEPMRREAAAQDLVEPGDAGRGHLGAGRVRVRGHGDFRTRAASRASGTTSSTRAANCRAKRTACPVSQLSRIAIHVRGRMPGIAFTKNSLAGATQ